jgi:hypothetical protein
LKKNTRALAVLLCAGALAAPPARAGEPPPAGPAAAAEGEGLRPVSEVPGALAVGAFSLAGGQLPADWKPLEFPKIPAHTSYRVEPDGAGFAVRAESKAAASGLIRKLPIDLRQYPIVRWRWRVENLIEGSDPTRKAGDDYPARIYIAFRYEPERVPFFRKAAFKAAQALFGDIPIGAINYIWTTRGTEGSVIDNPYAGSFVKMIPVRSGPERVGRWSEEQRNVYEDYRRAFGEEPPQIEGVAIMTDTDNTGESASALYGDIYFLPASAGTAGAAGEAGSAGGVAGPEPSAPAR